MDIKTITAHKDMSNSWSKGIVSCVCLKMSKQMKLEKKYSEHCFYFVVKVKPTQGYFPFRDINRTKSKRVKQTIAG